METARRVQNEQRVEAQRATKERDSAYRTGRTWVETFRRVAIVACAPHPQFREELGLLVPS